MFLCGRSTATIRPTRHDHQIVLIYRQVVGSESGGGPRERIPMPFVVRRANEKAVASTDVRGNGFMDTK